ncbi:VOC family protein [Nakamurella leprariae]|uniref:VOC family protein n=1 Tax=Nakamurella leprariae TaxID=2803911 RepID=A0A938Y796_9ACTN|nr:VOC family protein [Nakamurella leprariae]MBM9467115.1 VOC family protein [Nakamurella leprariae]
MDVLASRIILRPRDPIVTQAFYRDVLGLAISREFGPPETPGQVFYAGASQIEVSGRAAPADAPSSVAIWVQVRDVDAEAARLAAAGVTLERGPQLEPWGLKELWISDPDGTPLVLVEIPPEHPLRRDLRSLPLPDSPD